MLPATANVSSDAEAARSEARELTDRGYRGLAFERLLSGGADDVAERAADLGELGCDDIIVRCASADQPRALETLDTLGAAAKL